MSSTFYRNLRFLTLVSCTSPYYNQVNTYIGLEEFTMKSMSSRALALALSLTVLSACGSALAAEDDTMLISPAPSGIAVQLNGEALTFTDAVPVAQDGRTFLPFRAVFEAMGAEVSNEGNTITAVRDGKTLTMTIGSTEATLTEGGASSAITMDVAPYVDSTTWRTYVPVRFAAQAFGCAVGWDQDNQTAVIVDTEKLLDAALAEHQFTYMEKYLAYSQQFQEGIWDISAQFDGSATMFGAGPLSFQGSMDGTTADSLQMAAAMNLKMDLTAFLDAMSQVAGQASELTAEDQALLDALKSEGMDMEIRADMEKGVMYLTMGGSALETLGLPADTWYSFDMASMYGQMGLDYTALIDASKTMDASALLQTALQSADLSDKDTAYATVSALVNGAAKVLADDSFVKSGDNYTTTYALEEDGTKVTLSFTLTMQSDKVVGYELSMDSSTSVDDGEGGQITTTTAMKAGMDAENHMTATVSMGMDPLMDLSLNITGDYAAGDQAPETEPPAGATVVPYEQLIAGALGG